MQSHSPKAHLSTFITSQLHLLLPLRLLSHPKQDGDDPCDVRCQFEFHCAWVYICLSAPSSHPSVQIPLTWYMKPITTINYTATSRMRLIWPLKDSLKFRDGPIFDEWFKSKSGFMCVQRSSEYWWGGEIGRFSDLFKKRKITRSREV